jgi:seryl-tRNA synthetase
MIDLKKYTKEQIQNSIKRRNIIFDLDNFFDIYTQYKNLISQIETINSKINATAKVQDVNLGLSLKTELKQRQHELIILEPLILDLWNQIPNVLDDDVPDGMNDTDNIEVKRHGEIIFNKHHYDMDIFEDCVDFTGSRFVILKDKFSTLERAISCFMMNYLHSKGFTEFSVPYIMNFNGFTNSGHLPKEAENMFKIDNSNHYLIPTSEAVLVNLGKDKRWNDTKKFCALTDCFRKEAGSAGKDTKGLIRLHQFKKCEMVCFTQPDNSNQLLYEMTEISCNILTQLEIPWRVVVLCSGDIGFRSSKTYDIEVPIGGKWREISSISNCLEYQSHNINCKNSNKEYLHILNGSALAVGRTLATLLEVHYDPIKNIIKIPEILQKLLTFREIRL